MEDDPHFELIDPIEPVLDDPLRPSPTPIDDGYGIVGLIRAIAVGEDRWKVFEYHSPVTGLRRLAVERAGIVTEVGALPQAWRELSDAELIVLLAGH
jgi:hypothetical protein